MIGALFCLQLTFPHFGTTPRFFIPLGFLQHRLLALVLAHDFRRIFRGIFIFMLALIAIGAFWIIVWNQDGHHACKVACRYWFLIRFWSVAALPLPMITIVSLASLALGLLEYAFSAFPKYCFTFFIFIIYGALVGSKCRFPLALVNVATAFALLDREFRAWVCAGWLWRSLAFGSAHMAHRLRIFQRALLANDRDSQASLAFCAY